MTYEEKLDFVLDKIKDASHHKFPKELIGLMDNKLNEGELQQLLDKLYRDGNVDLHITYGYKINLTGRMIIDNKEGYVITKQKNYEIYTNSKAILTITKQTYLTTKLNTRWVIVGVVAAIIGILVTITIFLLQKI